MICTGCKKNLNQEKFSFRNKLKGILHKRCKTCCFASFKKCYAKNKSSYNKNRYNRQKKQRAVTSILLKKFKENLSCETCEENNPKTLDFHHTKNKSFDIGNGSSRGFSWDKIKKEILKCKVLCSNCHRKLHFNYRAVA